MEGRGGGLARILLVTMAMLRLSNPRHAFSLVEVMIVIAIIALLAAIAVPNFLRARKRAQATRIMDDLRLIDGALDLYATEFSKSQGDPAVWGMPSAPSISCAKNPTKAKTMKSHIEASPLQSAVRKSHPIGPSLLFRRWRPIRRS